MKETYVGKAGSKNEKNVYVRIYAKYSSQSIENNTSTVQYKSTLRVTGSGSYFDTYGTTTKSISGTGITSQSAGCGGRYYVQEVTLYEVSTTIKHDDDGTKSITASGGWLSGPWGISGTATGSADLPQIPRAATLYTDPEVVEQGGSLHIRTESPVNIFYQKIWYTLNNNEHILVDMQQPTDTSEGVYVFEFDIPYSTLVADLSTFTSGEILIGCETWTSNDSEGTLLGFSHKRAEIQNGTIPMSWVDNRTGRVGVTIGEKALAGDYFFATILDTYLGKSGHRTKTYLEDTAFVGNFVEL